MYKKYLIISILLALSLVFSTGCVKALPYEIPVITQQGEGGDEGSVTVYVLTKYELTEIVVEYESYDSWTALLESEFDGRNSKRTKVDWKGDYVTSIGNLRPNDPSQILVYLNGVYSNYFVANCEYLAGYTLAFVERGADIQTLL